MMHFVGKDFNNWLRSFQEGVLLFSIFFFFFHSHSFYLVIFKALADILQLPPTIEAC